MSLAEIDSRHYPVQSESPLFDFGLELDANTPALTSTSPSNVGQSPYLHQHPSTPQELPSGNSYFYSPAQTPYNLTGSPAGDYRNYSINYELGYPQSGMFMKEEDIMLLQGNGYMAGQGSLGERNNGHVYETWNEPPDRTLPSFSPSDDLFSRNTAGNIPSPVLTQISDKATTRPAPRACRAPRKRKAPGEKAEKPKLPKLTQPLSELTKGFHHLPIRDMECWVTRSTQDRRQEVEKRGGYITRPMNSFMLYRSAFAERTKYWCLQNNHQVVSSVSGESWPLEPDHIRGKYNDLAKKERENHQLAHPGYKFSPSKAQNGGRKRKGPSMVKSNEDGDAASLLSDLDDIDLETVNDGSPASPQKKSNKRTQKTATGSSLIYMDLPHQTESNGAIRSSFNHNNPGKAPPMCMGTQDMNGQYYQTTVRASSATPVPNPQLSTVIEDVTIRKTQSPTALGLQHPFLLRGATVEHPQILPIKSEPDDNSNVDPALLGGSEGMGFSADQFLPSHYMQEHNGSFDFEPLFSGTGQMLDSSFGTDSTSGIQQHGMMGLGEQGSCSLADVQRLPGYDESMGGFLDNQELWSVESMDPLEESVDFDYGQWVQVSAQ